MTPKSTEKSLLFFLSFNPKGVRSYGMMKKVKPRWYSKKRFIKVKTHKTDLRHGMFIYALVGLVQSTSSFGAPKFVEFRKKKCFYFLFFIFLPAEKQALIFISRRKKNAALVKFFEKVKKVRRLKLKNTLSVRQMRHAYKELWFNYGDILAIIVNPAISFGPTRYDAPVYAGSFTSGWVCGSDMVLPWRDKRLVGGNYQRVRAYAR